MKTIALSLCLVMFGLTAIAACRSPNEPSGDPKTPANSPIPKIEKNDDPSTSPVSPSKPTIGDAG